MTRNRTFIPAWPALAVLLMLAPSMPLRAQTVAITGGTVYPVVGPKLERATVLVRDGRIVAVGPDLAIPDDAERVDATGKWITPGLLHAASDLGLVGVRSIRATNETDDAQPISAALAAIDGLNPAAVAIPIARHEGVTGALALPTGGLVAGQGAVIDLAGATVEEMVVRSPAAMVADLSENGKRATGNSRASAMLRLRTLFRDALDYDRRRADFRRAGTQPYSAPAADLDALLPVLRGDVPFYVTANRRSDIENALRLRAEFPRLRLVVRGGAEAWQIGRELAAAGVPVALESRVDIPTFDALSPRLDNAALLREAGVTVMLVEGGPLFSESENPRNLRQVAGNAVRNGMTWDDALRAVTLAPALVFGVADRYGAIAPGRVANLVVWSGDPFEFSTRAERVMIRGREMPMTNRQTELLERYRTLPPAY